LLGDYAQHPQWQQRLWLSACDLSGSGYGLDEVLWWLLEAAAAVDAPEKREAALRTIANAYMMPRLSAREYMRRREADLAGCVATQRKPSTRVISSTGDFDS
jgi:hypothetical protein